MVKREFLIRAICDIRGYLSIDSRSPHCAQRCFIGRLAKRPGPGSMPPTYCGLRKAPTAKNRYYQTKPSFLPTNRIVTHFRSATCDSAAQSWLSLNKGVQLHVSMRNIEVKWCFSAPKRHQQTTTCSRATLGIMPFPKTNQGGDASVTAGGPVGVRPSSGAASFRQSRRPANPENVESLSNAAPEDGRIPSLRHNPWRLLALPAGHGIIAAVR
jgi:hypothetical protein